MRTGTLLTLTMAASALLNAQTGKPQGLTSQPNQTDSALTAETRRVFIVIVDNISKAAKEMPENLYSFRPSGDARSFGELVAHIATVQNTLCSTMNGHQAHKAGSPATKDTMIADLGNSDRECDESFDELSAQNANVKVQTPAGQLTHLAALVYIITHASEEYGQLAIYLELNKLHPPSSDQTKKVL
jgi:uncharacterized damage-inducible protein DinB